MNKNELKLILEELNMHPGKKFGQNFMIDENLSEFIARTANLDKDSLAVEVGPGLGALTEKLLKNGANLIAVEIDKRLQEYLKGNFQQDNFKLLEGDACRVDIEAAVYTALQELETNTWKCIANLPYSISSPFIARILLFNLLPEEMLFLLQKETAQRLAAKRNEKNYGSLTVRVQTLYNVKIVRNVSPNVFFPIPDVDSALAKFQLKKEHPSRDEMKLISKVVKAAFSQRRKKMIKALSVLFGRDHCEKVFMELNISTNARAQELSVEEFRELATKLGHNENS
jgi:16S rRNA (adenine1518-N6/adenine1519-N6)-dimethyltransferase